jgi:DNA-binding NarL/FixJ family response regulator
LSPPEQALQVEDIMTRVIVADDHPLFREGVSTLMGQLMPDAQIVEAGDWSAVERALLDGADPDVLVLDLKFPGLNPVDADVTP